MLLILSVFGKRSNQRSVLLAPWASKLLEITFLLCSAKMYCLRVVVVVVVVVVYAYRQEVNCSRRAPGYFNLIRGKAPLAARDSSEVARA